MPGLDLKLQHGFHEAMAAHNRGGIRALIADRIELGGQQKR
jgi:hypothetical protein